jgi:tetratricopeptide (TPR) repeat protein
VRFEQLRDSGCEALYNLDYKTARIHFSEIVRLLPQHPAGPQYMASALLFETLYKSRRLQASLYSSKSFYSGSEDKADPNIVKQFRTFTREAQRLADTRLKQYPKDTEALYILGNIAALKASFGEAVERRHFAALRDGSEAVAKHRRVLEIDPSYVDAEVTIGMYDYIVGSLPLPVKVMAGVFGAQGSKKRGIATIERVAKTGNAGRDQARTLLVLLYIREKRYNEAADQARQLSAKYPRNYLYRLEMADALVSQVTQAATAQDAANAKAASEAYAVYESLLRDKDVTGTVTRLKDLIHFKYGEALLKTGQNERAAAEFLAATRVSGADEGLVTMAHLSAAQSLDAANRRTDALAQYRLVLARPDVYDAHNKATKALNEQR